MKRIISLILLLSILSAAFIGCTESEPETADTTKKPTPAATTPPDTLADTEPTEQYVVNVNNGKFHLPDCTYAQKISDENRDTLSCSYDEMINQGYVACGHCLATAPSTDSTEAPSTDTTDTPSTESSTAPNTTEIPAATETPEGELHILNTGTKKIHKPDFRYAENKNREEYTGDINDLLEEGYTLCKTCHKD